MARSSLRQLHSFAVDSSQPFTCALGRIVYAGIKWNSLATYGHAAPPDYMRPTAHHLIVLTLEGCADYRDETGVRAVLRPGDLLWARPGLNQSYGPRPGHKWSELFVWFEGRIFDTWQSQGIPGDKTRIMKLGDARLWLERIASSVAAEPVGTPERALIRLCRFQQLLADALALESAQSGSGQDGQAWLSQAQQLLATESINRPRLEAVARTMHLSYVAFRKRFLRLAGTSPGHYRAVQVMRHATGLLQEENRSLKEIADALGFSDAFNFSRRFRQIMGLSPRDFRKRMNRGRENSAPPRKRP